MLCLQTPLNDTKVNDIVAYVMTFKLKIGFPLCYPWGYSVHNHIFINWYVYIIGRGWRSEGEVDGHGRQGQGHGKEGQGQRGHDRGKQNHSIHCIEFERIQFQSWLDISATPKFEQISNYLFFVYQSVCCTSVCSFHLCLMSLSITVKS